MTLAVTVVCQDGVVVAADSRTTLASDRTLRVASDFTHKVFESGRVAVTTYGEALLLGRSIASHMAEFTVAEADSCEHPGPTAQALAAHARHRGAGTGVLVAGRGRSDRDRHGYGGGRLSLGAAHDGAG